LHVTSTLTDRGTDVVVVVDSLHDAPAGEPGGASSLDTAVRGAAGIAGHYLDRGDRVGLLEFGGITRWIPPGAGRAQRVRLLDWLLDVSVHVEGVAAPTRALGPRIVPLRALVVVLSPLLDDRIAAL